MSKTVSKRATKQIAAIRSKDLHCSVYSLSNNFIAKPCSPDYAWSELYRFDFAKLRVDDTGSVWTVQVHGNLWYKLREEV